MTPYERIDKLEELVRVILARLDRVEQHPALSVPPAQDHGSTLHLPAKGKH